jgi:hypothetical protein
VTSLPASPKTNKPGTSIIGIVLGVVLGLALLAAIIIILLRRHRRRGAAPRISQLDLAHPDLHLQPLNTSYSIYAEPTPSHIDPFTAPPPPPPPPPPLHPDSRFSKERNNHATSLQLLLRLEACERRLSSTPGEMFTGDAGSPVPTEQLPHQVDDLRREVERLREMLAEAGIAPPRYQS